VGPATANIRLQFEQRGNGGAVHLIDADARIQGDSLLKCETTRFQFALTALGLRFVEESERYHLYFTISGMARFALAAGDKPDGPLSWLPAIEMQMVECPLTTDVSVLAKHINFLIPLPKPETFKFLGCFEFELRAIGYAPQDPVFRVPKPAMMLSGQVKFSSGGSDAVDARVDFHNLHIGLPAPGKNFPQLYLKGLGIKLSVGSAFELGGSVDFIDEGTDLGGGVTGEGFSGTGEMQIQGLPRITAGFAFLRVKRNPQDDPLRAWFLYFEASRFSLEMPVIRIFLREIGIGFGYRMTLAMIKSVDEVDDPKQLLKVLKQQGKQQGELSHFAAWRVDLEDAGQDPRWTIALRAMLSQNSAARTPTDWNVDKEKLLPNLFLLDVVAAVRSDLTLLMVARAWFLTNYHDFTMEQPSALRDHPLFAGFVILSPRKKRLLANFSSNPDAEFGEHSPVPEIVKKAIHGAKFSATLLVEPGLVHYELGWPNQLRWEADFSVLKLQFCGGLIYRLSKTEFVMGQSYLARGSLQFSAGVDFGFVGARISATANVAYGARYIGVLSFEDTTNQSAFYGGAGIEINVAVSLEFWIEIDALFGSITLDYSFSFAVNFTASVEVGILLTPALGVRGTATLGLNVMGHDLHFAIRVAFAEGAVTKAYELTSKFLNVGLEAGDVEAIPGVPDNARLSRSASPPLIPAGLAPGWPLSSLAAPLGPAFVPRLAQHNALAHGPDAFETPTYRVLTWRLGKFAYLLLVPGGEVLDPRRAQRTVPRERGFLPVPPTNPATVTNDYELTWTIPANVTVLQADANLGGKFVAFTNKWKVKGWTEKLDSQFNGLDRNTPYATGSSPQGSPTDVLLGQWLSLAYELDNAPGTVTQWSDLKPAGDPALIPEVDPAIADPRVHEPTEAAFEAAVRGAAEQFSSSPYFKRSDGEYDVTLREAFDNQTSLYAENGVAKPYSPKETPAYLKTQQVFQTRSVILRSFVSQFREFVESVRASNDTTLDFPGAALACRFGLVLRCDLATDSDDLYQSVIDSLNAAKITQRTDPAAAAPDGAKTQPVRIFNPPDRSFANLPPTLDRLVHYQHEGTVAIDWDLKWDDRSRPAFASATVKADGTIHKITVAEGSMGYIRALPPLVSIDPPPGAGRASVLRNRINPDGSLKPDAVLVFGAGKGYSSATPPAITFSPPPAGGISATGHVNPAKINASGALAVDAVVIDNSGAGYLLANPPAVTIDLPTGSVQAVAAFDATRIDDTTGEVATDAITVSNAGAGYDLSNPPKVAIGAPPRCSEKDPHHHLDHYIVRRRWLDGNTGEKEFRVKPSDVLHRDKNNTLKRLKPRFQFVDHFDGEPAESLASLPADGHRYAYLIVPIDLTGIPSSRPRTVIVRRMPTTAPAPVVESEFLVDYRVDRIDAPSRTSPTLRPVQRLAFVWTPPTDPTIGPVVAVAGVKLIFRSDEVLALGQYGQDSDAGGPRSKGLATSNSRPLRTDRIFEFPLSAAEIRPLPNAPDSDQRRFFIDLRPFSDSGADPTIRLPDLDGPPSKEGQNIAWIPRGWRVFVQTKSATGVYSALVPVTLRLRFTTSEQLTSPNLPTPEERRTSTLEWLPNPVAMDMLPPRDMMGQPGFALVPMPPTQPIGVAADLGHFTLHPSRRRCQKIVWNQMGTAGAVLPTPIAAPREFHAGYELFEFDVDAHLSDKIINDPNPTPVPFEDWVGKANLRSLQRFEMLPADMLLVSPSDTADTPKWEAWYPSMVKRRELQVEVDAKAKKRGSQALYSSWYSWRESVLVWPDFAEPDSRIVEVEVPKNGTKRWVINNRLHRTLDNLIKLLDEQITADNPGATISFGPTPATPATLAALMTATDPAVDPYGWNLLNRLGLSVSFTFRNGLGDPIPAQEVLTALLPLVQRGPNHDFLFVECLYQPAKATRPAPDESKRIDGDVLPEEMLAVVQLSMRPKVEPIYQYTRYEFIAVPDGPNLFVSFTAPTPKTAAIVKGFQSDEQFDVSPHGGNPQTTMQVEKPAGSKLVVLCRYPVGTARTTLKGALAIDATGKPAPFTRPDGSVVAPFDPTVITDFDATDNDSTLFSSSIESIAGDLAAVDKRYRFLRDAIEALNLREIPKSALTLQMPDDLTKKDQNPSGVEVLAWLQRFFDHGANTKGNFNDGPWLAHAYPRSLAIAAIAPHPETGVLEYCQPIEDLYAHTTRYFIRPSSRYDAIWSSVGQSHTLFRDRDGNVDLAAIAANRKSLMTFTPPPPGGLDLVIPRIRPIAPPSVLFSGRLDALPPTNLAELQPKPPGKTWQVVLAKHAEQSLTEKNRTLKGRLAYQQIAVTLLRQFQFQTVLDDKNLPVPLFDQYVTVEFPNTGTILATGETLSFVKGATTLLALATNDLAGLLAALTPQVGSHLPVTLPGAAGTSRLLFFSQKEVKLVKNTASGTLDLSTSRRPVPRWTTTPPALPGPFVESMRRDPLKDYMVETPDALRQFNLPPRLGLFGQGAVVYQWQALPFYYRHVLVAIAQATDVVSDLTTVSQKDFEYDSPVPKALMEGALGSIGRFRRIQIRLENFWNCLTDDAKARWPIETPVTSSVEQPRPYSAVVDPQVLYQFVLRRPGGVMQVLSQIFFDAKSTTKYDRRNIPGSVAGVTYTTEVVQREPWGVDARMPFEEYLDVNLKPDPADGAAVSRPISSRFNFDPAKVIAANATLATPADAAQFPRSAVLSLSKRLANLAPLEQLLGGNRDNAFQLQARRFLDRVREFHQTTPADAVPDIHEDVSVGLDQLFELSDDPALVAINPATRRVTWISKDVAKLFSAAQRAVLDGDGGWKTSAACGLTIAELLKADTRPGPTEVDLAFDAADLIPNVTGDPIAARFSYPAAGRIRWKFGAITPTDLATLNNFANAGSGFGPSFRAAVTTIIKIGPNVAAEVNIEEADFALRPTVVEIRAKGLEFAFGFSRGAMVFKGPMMAAEIAALRAARKPDSMGALVEIDRALIALLHNDSLRSGFDGAALQIQAVRGSAPSKTTDIHPFIDVNT